MATPAPRSVPTQQAPRSNKLRHDQESLGTAQNASTDVITWRVILPLRVIGVVASLAFLAFSAGSAFQFFSDGPRLEYVWSVILCAAGGVAGLLYCFATSLQLANDCVVVKNFGVTQEIPLSEIVRMESGYSGMAARSRPSPSRSPTTRGGWLTSRADRVVATIRATALQEGAEPLRAVRGHDIRPHTRGGAHRRPRPHAEHALWSPPQRPHHMDKYEGAPVTGEHGGVVVYWRPMCTFCMKLLLRLRFTRLEYTTVNIWKAPEAAAFVRSVADGNETVPTVTVAGHAMVNPSKKELMEAVRTHAPHLLTKPN